MPKRVLIINAYSSLNRGDAGIVVAMIHLLREVYDNPKIMVASSYWQENVEFYKKYNVESVPQAWGLHSGAGLLRRYAAGILCLLRLLAGRGLPKHFPYVCEADIILSAGGGYLYSSAKGPAGVGLVNALFNYYCASRVKGKVLGFPQSVGPFKFKIDRWLASVSLSDCTLMSREHVSTQELLSFSKPIKHVDALDVAFTLSSSKPSLLKSGASGNILGVTVLDWSFANAGSNSSTIDGYLKKVAKVIGRYLIDYPQAEVKIFPQVNVGATDSDLPVSLLLENLVNDKRCYVEILDDDITPESLIDRYAKCTCFIGSRMHSAIFAMVAEVPTVALAYQPKTVGTFERLGCVNDVLPINDFDSDELYRILVARLKAGPQWTRSDSLSLRNSIKEMLLSFDNYGKCK